MKIKLSFDLRNQTKKSHVVILTCVCGRTRTHAQTHKIHTHTRTNIPYTHKIKCAIRLTLNIHVINTNLSTWYFFNGPHTYTHTYIYTYIRTYILMYMKLLLLRTFINIIIIVLTYRWLVLFERILIPLKYFVYFFFPPLSLFVIFSMIYKEWRALAREKKKN